MVQHSHCHSSMPASDRWPCAQLGYMQKARYMSSNSGGSWFNGACSYTQVGELQEQWLQAS